MTGVDAKTCKLIVLDRTINSMTMFKQITYAAYRQNARNGMTRLMDGNISPCT